jgi:hypothetical protein
MASAEDSARYRQRQRDGLMPVTTLIGDTMIRALIAVGWLRPEFADSKPHIQAAVQRLHNAYASSVTRDDIEI